MYNIAGYILVVFHKLVKSRLETHRRQADQADQSSISQKRQTLSQHHNITARENFIHQNVVFIWVFVQILPISRILDSNRNKRNLDLNNPLKQLEEERL